MKPTTTRLALGGLLATGLLVPTTGSAQTQMPTVKQFFACYVPTTGTVYLIKQPGLRPACASGHVEFNWIAGGSGAGVTPDVVITDANGWAATGTFGSGAIPVTGPGVRVMWYPRRAAFRAGSVAGTQWDDANVGDYSVALGQNTIASAHHSIATGIWSTATGNFSTAMGTATAASGHSSFAIGQGTVASGTNSTALGFGSRASGRSSTALGQNTTASGTNSTAMGLSSTANGEPSTAMGANTTAGGDFSTAMGFSTSAGGDFSTAMGDRTTASGGRSTAIGQVTTASGEASTAVGTDASTNGMTGSFVYGDMSAFASRGVVQSTVPNQFLVRASGGFRFRTSPDLTTGCDISGGTVPGSLTCSGTIASAAGGFRFPDNTVQTTAATGGITGWEFVSASSEPDLAPAAVTSVIALCPVGKKVLGGGANSGLADGAKVTLVESSSLFRADGREGWLASWRNDTPATLIDLSLNVHLQCANAS